MLLCFKHALIPESFVVCSLFLTSNSDRYLVLCYVFFLNNQVLSTTADIPTLPRVILLQSTLNRTKDSRVLMPSVTVTLSGKPHRINEKYLKQIFLCTKCMFFLRRTGFETILLQYAQKMRTLATPIASLHFTAPVEATTHHDDVGLISQAHIIIESSCDDTGQPCSCKPSLIQRQRKQQTGNLCSVCVCLH